MDPRQELAEIIRNLRKNSGLKQEAFARELGVVAAHLSRLENGQGLPSIRLVHKIADRFDADRGRLMRLLRQIKGFEEPGETNLFDIAPCAHIPGHPDRSVPVFAEREEVRGYLSAIEKRRRPPQSDRTAPVNAAMTRDRVAFWLEVGDAAQPDGALRQGDLVLVEPSHPAIAGTPCLVVTPNELVLASWHETRDAIVLEALDGKPDARALPRQQFERSGGRSYRVAGVHPCYRAFARTAD